MPQLMCKRCGIDIDSGVHCDDCRDILDVARYRKSSELEREQTREWFEMGIPVREISETTGRSHQMISWWAKQNGWERFRWVR